MKLTKKFAMKCLTAFCVIVLLIGVDQLTKVLAVKYLDEGKSYPLIGSLISLRIEYNPGIAYGIGHNAPTALKLAVIVLTGVIMVALAVLFFVVDERRTLLRIAFLFVVGGGIGNLIDRVAFRVWLPDGGGVRDMVDLSRFGFAVCNFADFFISAGAVMLVLSFLFFDQDAIFPQGKYKALQKESEERKKATAENTQGEGKE